MVEAPSVEALERCIRSFSGRAVLVLGDPVLDVYVYGSSHRISREAPVLIVREEASETRLGGAANAAANLAALGARTRLVGLVGEDEASRQLEAQARAQKIEPALIRAATFRTVTKTRILAGGLHTRKQQMLRLDRGPDGRFQGDELAERIEAEVLAQLDQVDAVVISDYGEGYSLTEVYARLASAAMAKNKIVVADSRAGVDQYRGVTSVTPNEPEMEEASPKYPLHDDASALAAARRLREHLDCKAVLLTRGREGMAIAERDVPGVLLGAHGSHEALDVTGAGDTVVAAYTLALASGASVIEAAVIANCAASISVRRTGAATVEPEELLAEIARFSAASLRTGAEA